MLVHLWKHTPVAYITTALGLTGPCLDSYPLTEYYEHTIACVLLHLRTIRQHGRVGPCQLITSSNVAPKAADHAVTCWNPQHAVTCA
jgi:hypothetical protein